MIGKILNGRYEIIDKIGEGGMAYVYKARCHLLNRDVAVKILKREFSNDDNIVAKFKGEAAAAAGLCGSNIVNIFDVGSENDTNYIVMELVEGKTLKEHIQENGAIEEKRAVEIGLQIAKALQSAHGKRVIHRDIKPHNIIVGKNGAVKVADFGIAKAVDQSTITHTSKVMGTAHYFSPEQAKGGYVDFRSDIYSLGIVLYEMVTGEVPYDSDSIVSVAIKHIQEEVIQPKELNGKISPGLNDVILKCLEKDPAKRYQTANELYDDLMRVKDKKKIVIERAKEDMQHTKVMNAVDVEKEIAKVQQGKKEEPEKSGEKKSKKKFIIIAAVLAGILLISIGTTVALLSPKNDSNSEVPKVSKSIVPFIVGEKVEDIIDTLKADDLDYSIVREAKSDYPEGTIIDCKPVGGSKVERGTVLSLVVSKGPEGIKVKDYREMDINTIKGLLRTDGLSLGNIKREFSILEVGKIINQTPSPGTEVDKNSEISFVVSKGPEISLIKVPNFVGQELENVKNMIKDSGLVLKEATPIETSDPNRKDIVFSQSISEGVEVKEGSEINISYYKHKPNDTIFVPNFIGKIGVEAEQKAYGAGVKVKIEGDDFHKVYEQSVPAGKEVEVGTLVVLKTKKEEE